jgi:hypothetical protein
MWRGDESRKGDTETPNTFLLMPKLCAKRETGMYGTNQIRLVLIRCVCCEKWQVVRLDPEDSLCLDPITHATAYN